MEDIQSWWEVPSIAHFCSMFQAAFDLLDFEIEELEEALLLDSSSTENETTLLDHLITRLLCGCLKSEDVGLHNYDEFLREYIVNRWRGEGRNVDELVGTAFQFLNLRLKVEILYSLCECRLEADDVSDRIKNLAGENLRIEPIGKDSTGATYWYFYGLRLYKEAADKVSPPAKQQRKNDTRKENLETKQERSKPKSLLKEGNTLNGVKNNALTKVVTSGGRKRCCPRAAWSIVCYNEHDWQNLADKFVKSESKKEKELGDSLTESLVEIHRIAIEKEKTIRKRLIALLPKRVSSRIEGIKKQEKNAIENKEMKQRALAVEQEKQQQAREQSERRMHDLLIKTREERGERISERMIARDGLKVLRSRVKL